MKKVPVRIIEGGRVTIPADIREQYDLERGDRVWVTVEPMDESKKGDGKDLLGV